MSTRVKLWFERFPFPEIEEKISNAREFTRLFGSIRFKTLKGWGKVWDAIVDTGAPISVIPLDIWTELEYKILAEQEIQGINPRKECSLPALIGNVTCVLIDDVGNVSEELGILSYLALSNRVPLILGFKDLLEKFKVYFSFKEDTGFVEC